MGKMLVTNIKSMIQMLEMVDKPASENAIKWQPPGCGKANFFKITNQILIVRYCCPRWRCKSWWTNTNQIFGINTFIHTVAVFPGQTVIHKIWKMWMLILPRTSQGSGCIFALCFHFCFASVSFLTLITVFFLYDVTTMRKLLSAVKAGSTFFSGQN